MKRFGIYSAFVISGFMIAMLGCNSHSSNELTIGVDLPMTGDVAYYGTSAKNGIELAKDQLDSTNDFEKNNIHVIYEDNQGQGRQAAVALSKLISADNVPAVIGGGSSTETMAAAPIAEKNQTILISPISSATSISQAGQFIYRTCPSDLTQAEDLGDWVKQENYSKVSIIYVNSSWGTGFKDNFVNHFQKINGHILSIISTDPGQSDFRTQIASIKRTNADAYVFIVYAKEGGTLVRQGRELQIKNQIFGADPWSQSDFRNGAGSNAEGVKYTTPSQDTGKLFQKFRTDYLTKYHSEPDVYASNGYDCMMLLAKMYLQGARSGADFKKSLDNVTDFNGATGITHFDKNGDVIGKKFGRYIVKNGSPSLIK